MIEASVILFVFLVAGLLFVGSRLMAQNARSNPAAELVRLQETLAWHEERLHQAKQKNWDYDMINRIAGELAETRAQLARLNARPVAAPASGLERS
ncbi:hypothetical protein [Opitutus sp. GAS368]|jgi:hypothetical protein|uniref:hypothetical protein n=1 Tax=Opitutus sp. GAS368 TaxID=1882749 RepID=UPI00087CB9D1|nr:hypothetical protein [Opitutus sp. GAS368]SDR96881.1 hypothetical protein SAMN05444173_1486 [Opitutus sp. GAS368]